MTFLTHHVTGNTLRLAVTADHVLILYMSLYMYYPLSVSQTGQA